MTIKQVFNAEETLREWLGEGGHPVSNSQDRADVCTGRVSGVPCPYNCRSGWNTPEVIANAIRKAFEIKNHLKLRVEGEEALGHCEICACVLSLKIHVPLQTILNHTSKEELGKFPSFCWITTEQKQP